MVLRLRGGPEPDPKQQIQKLREEMMKRKKLKQAKQGIRFDNIYLMALHFNFT